MEAIMYLIFILAGLALFGGAALRWGVDSRDALNTREFPRESGILR